MSYNKPNLLKATNTIDYFLITDLYLQHSENIHRDSVLNLKTPWVLSKNDWNIEYISVWS